MDETEALEALSNLLTDLAAHPYDLSLHVQHVNLATSTGLEEQVQAAREMLTNYWAAGDEIWLPLIENKEKSVDLDTDEGLQDVLELYEQAENDYLCALPISISLRLSGLLFISHPNPPEACQLSHRATRSPCIITAGPCSL